MLARPFDFEDGPSRVLVDSHVNATWSLAGTIQKFASVVALSLNGGNLAVHVFGLGSHVERISEGRLLHHAALGAEAKRLAKALNLSYCVVRK